MSGPDPLKEAAKEVNKEENFEENKKPKHSETSSYCNVDETKTDSNVDETKTDSNVDETKTDSTETGNYDPKNVYYEGDLAVYRDPASGTEYTWDNEKNEWILRSSVQYGFEDDTHVYTDSEGGKYFWDKEKNAWFPKVDDDFMARYQLNYGFVDNTKVEVKNADNLPKTEEKPKKVKGEKRAASQPTWFEVDETQNTNVYVSNLPTDVNEEEFVELMQKCGLVMRDPSTGKYKVKLYKEPGTGYLKGDALCTYIKIESVDLSLNLLDGYEYKNHKIKVERAKFEMKGNFDPNLKPKMKKKKDKMKLKKQQEKLFDWRPEKPVGENAKHERIVIVRNLFEPKIFDIDVGLILEFQQDLRDECSKIGEVRKIQIFDRHPEGVAQINMANPEEAEQVVNLLNGRWFMKRKLSAEIWDGKTKFKIAETDSEISQRLDNWDKFLEEDNENIESKNQIKVND